VNRFKVLRIIAAFVVIPLDGNCGAHTGFGRWSHLQQDGAFGCQFMRTWQFHHAQGREERRFATRCVAHDANHGQFDVLIHMSRGLDAIHEFAQCGIAR
jgi:hypothetical protein